MKVTLSDRFVWGQGGLGHAHLAISINNNDFLPHLAKNHYSAASLILFARINGIFSFTHSYNCCVFRPVFNFFPPP